MKALNTVRKFLIHNKTLIRLWWLNTEKENGKEFWNWMKNVYGRKHRMYDGWCINRIRIQNTEQTKLNIEYEWKTESLLLFVWMHFVILITYNRFGISDPMNHWQMINLTILSNQALWIANSHACIPYSITHWLQSDQQSDIRIQLLLLFRNMLRLSNGTFSIKHSMCSFLHSRFRTNE